MVPAHDTEAYDVVVVVQDFKAFGAVGGREAGNDVDLAEGAYVAVPADDLAALDEVLVRLWVVEAANDGPNGGDWGRDLLDHGGAALVGSHDVRVVASHGVWHRGGAGERILVDSQAFLVSFDSVLEREEKKRDGSLVSGDYLV
ncbi:hypothetical protein F0562_017752 [Nyssa sinensis]|uniref:Uncharacterized protein n=1 Tax=Nyssa sinensis TaxID=561372 RepID=A0A5J4ZHB3_9ASTE|nr:hypothetical protein F0562_017752 [Nyssa sinensis]